MDLEWGAWELREITAVGVFARAVVDSTEVLRISAPRPAAGIVDARMVRHRMDAHLDDRHVYVLGSLNWRIHYVPAGESTEVGAFTSRETYRVRVPLVFDEFMRPVRGADPEVALVSSEATLRRMFLCSDEGGRIGLVTRIHAGVEVSGPVRMHVAVLGPDENRGDEW